MLQPLHAVGLRILIFLHFLVRVLTDSAFIKAMELEYLGQGITMGVGALETS